MVPYSKNNNNNNEYDFNQICIFNILFLFSFKKYLFKNFNIIRITYYFTGFCFVFDLENLFNNGFGLIG